MAGRVRTGQVNKIPPWIFNMVQLLLYLVQSEAWDGYAAPPSLRPMLFRTGGNQEA